MSRSLPYLGQEQTNALWASAFACATVALRDWTPGDAKPSEVDGKRRARAAELAWQAIDDYWKLVNAE